MQKHVFLAAVRRIRCNLLKRFFRSGSACVVASLFAGCAALSNEYQDLHHTYYVYETDGPKVFEQYLFSENYNPFRTTTVLIPTPEITKVGGEGWTADSARYVGKIDLAKADREISNYPAHRFPSQLYRIVDSINPTLGIGPARIIGISPLAIAFVDVPMGQFSVKVANARSEIGSPMMAMGRRLIILPDQRSMNEIVEKVVIYPVTMTLGDAEKIMFHAPTPEVMATLFTMQKPLTIREAIPMVGSPDQFLNVASRENIVVTFHRRDASH